MGQKSAAVVLAGAAMIALPARGAARDARTGKTARASASAAASGPAKRLSPVEQLEQWSRALRDKKSATAYASMSAFALRKSSGELGQRAALALGYFDYSKGNYIAARRWFDKAAGDVLLGDYILYWSAETDRAQGRSIQAMEELLHLRHNFPDSVMTEQALESLGEAALGANQPQTVLDALARYPETDARPTLLFARARAHEQAGQLEQAAADYLAVHDRFPLSLPTHEAGMKADMLRSKLGSAFPAEPLDVRLSRAAALFAGREWYEAREDYIALLPEIAGADRDRAQLRIAQCRVALGADLSALTGLTLVDADVDAERLYSLSQAYRTLPSESSMLAAIEATVARAPGSHWAEQALFAAGNYYWVNLDRDRAAAYYLRLEQTFPGSPDTAAANWRVAWTAVLERRQEATHLLEQHLEKFPNSPFITDDLYWLGREAEKNSDIPHARAYYEKIAERFPLTYFGGLAMARLTAIGAGPSIDPPSFTRILPPAPPLPVVAAIPVVAAGRQARADALTSIAFDSSAELELRAAYATTSEPRLLLEAAQAAANAGHYGESMSTARQVYPQLEARRFEDVSREIWLAAFPLPYERPLRDDARRAGVDPMLVAGLIRQESTFETNAVSHAGAYGLMQVLPKTARLLAHQLHQSYSRAALTEPEYNLRLGTVYLAGLLKTWGSPEAALAAYNAGEDHVGTWQSGQMFTEPAEFVDSIPFTETREYVQIVLRNAEVYRRLYGPANEVAAKAAKPSIARKPSTGVKAKKGAKG